MADDIAKWAIPRLERLLPLDADTLAQVVEYALTLPKDGAADHLKNLLGDSPQALEFISSFNSRRRDASAETSSTAAATRQSAAPQDGHASRPQQRPPRKKKNIHALPARQIRNNVPSGGAYQKPVEEDYMAASSHRPKGNLAASLSLSATPEVIARPLPTIVDAVSPQAAPSRSESPARSQQSRKAATTTVKISGGKPMQGSSAILSDLDSAIRSLELQTNPTLSAASPDESAADRAARSCACMATTHPLLASAPNCLSCGQIICLKQGLGPCVSCGAPLLSRDDIAALLRVLKDERGRERQDAGNKLHKRAEVAAKPKPFSGRDFLSSAVSKAAASQTSSPLSGRSRDPSPRGGGGGGGSTGARSTGMPVPAAASEALAHRDRLLDFQAHNAQRTTVHDEAADFTVPVASGDGTTMRAGSNIWASPAERAAELKRQQKRLRELEFAARPEWERKREVASIDVVKGKVVRRFVERRFEDEERGRDDDAGAGQGVGDDDGVVGAEQAGGGHRGGAAGLARNPLLGKLIRPVYKLPDGGEAGVKGKEMAVGEGAQQRGKAQTWRRVQDDLDDNEGVILDGGTRGFRSGAGIEGIDAA